MGNRVYLVLALSVWVASLVSGFQSHRLPFPHRRWVQSSSRIGDLSSSSAGIKDLVYGDDDGEEDRKKWLVWLVGGKPRGSSDIKMREAEDLGGVPRSDRYSSR